MISSVFKNMQQQYQGSILVAWQIRFFRSYGLWFKSVFLLLSCWIGMTSWKIALFFPSFIAGDISGTNANYHAQLQESKRHHCWSYIKQTGGRAMSFTIRNCLVHRAVSLCIRMSQPWSIRPWKMNKYEQHWTTHIWRVVPNSKENPSTITSQMFCTKGTDAFPHFQ